MAICKAAEAGDVSIVDGGQRRRGPLQPAEASRVLLECLNRQMLFIVLEIRVCGEDQHLVQMSDGTDQKVYCRPLHAFATADITEFRCLDEVSDA